MKLFSFILLSAVAATGTVEDGARRRTPVGHMASVAAAVNENLEMFSDKGNFIKKKKEQYAERVKVIEELVTK